MEWPFSATVKPAFEGWRYYNPVYLTCRWFVPFIGHMGICTSAGVIRDFAGPYYVSVSSVVR